MMAAHSQQGKTCRYIRHLRRNLEDILKLAALDIYLHWMNINSLQFYMMYSMQDVLIERHGV